MRASLRAHDAAAIRYGVWVAWAAWWVHREMLARGHPPADCARFAAHGETTRTGLLGLCALAWGGVMGAPDLDMLRASPILTAAHYWYLAEQLLYTLERVGLPDADRLEVAEHRDRCLEALWQACAAEWGAPCDRAPDAAVQ